MLPTRAGFCGVLADVLSVEKNLQTCLRILGSWRGDEERQKLLMPYQRGLGGSDIVGRSFSSMPSRRWDQAYSSTRVEGKWSRTWQNRAPGECVERAGMASPRLIHQRELPRQRLSGRRRGDQEEVASNGGFVHGGLPLRGICHITTAPTVKLLGPGAEFRTLC